MDPALDDIENSGDSKDDSRTSTSILPSGIIIEFLLLVLNFYLAIAFGFHGKEANMMKSRSNSDMHRGFVYKIALAAVVLPFFRYACTLSFMFEGLLYRHEATGCEWAADFAYVGLMLGLVPTYTFLWARQRAFYSHPSLSGKYGYFINFTSKFILVPIITQGLISVVLATYTDEYIAGFDECELLPGASSIDYREYLYAGVMVSSQIVLLVLFITPIVSHLKSQKKHNTIRRKADEEIRSKSVTESAFRQYTVAENDDKKTVELNSHSEPGTAKENGGSEISGLKAQDIRSEVIIRVSDIIPDSTHNSKNNLSVDPQTADVSDCESQSSKIASTIKRQGTRATNFIKRAARQRQSHRGSGKVLIIIKRTLYLALISVLSDLTVLMITAIWSEHIPQSTQFVIYDISMFINVVTVTASFDNWCKILRSPCTVACK